MRSPQMSTFATPGTRSSRALTFQYAVIDMSMSEYSSDVIPIFMTRLVADSGWIMTGGAAHRGNVEDTAAIRSATSCRAVRRSSPSLKMSSICESCSTDLDLITSSPGTPLSACSIGTVTRDSTSVADRPSARVWISTFGGANSGKTSTGVPRSCWTPKKISAAAAAATM